MSKLTFEDLQAYQSKLLELRQINCDLQEQLEAARQRSGSSEPDQIEALKQQNKALRIKINKETNDHQQLEEQIDQMKIMQFLSADNIVEIQFPDLQKLPTNIRQIAKEVGELISKIREQLIRRKSLTADVNECAIKTKRISKLSETLQEEIVQLRESHKTELDNLEAVRSAVKNLEEETKRLREQLHSAPVHQAAGLSAEDLVFEKAEIERIQKTLQQRRQEFEQEKKQLEEKTADYNRQIEDSNSANDIYQKKMMRQINELQKEIIRRSGIVYIPSKAHHLDQEQAAKLFVESNKLIDQIAQSQQKCWDQEERVAFTRNSKEILEKDLARMLVGSDGDIAKACALLQKYETENRQK